MHITIFGAAGKVGRLVVQELLARDHTVTAFVHRNSPFEESGRLRIAKGDVHEAADVAASTEGSQAVISVVSSWGTPDKDTLTAAMTNICPAMQAAGIRRIISLTGGDARAAGDSLSAMHRFNHALFNIIGPKIVVDAERHIAILKDSGLDYTVLRAPLMTKNPSKAYRLDDQRPQLWDTVSYASVAAAMVDVLEQSSHIGSSPYIHRA
jgi:putative NADH-flavin reductase